MPKFSIILATRDRPLLFNEAMVSVVGQDYQDFEIIVVDDGSTDENKEKYVPIYEQALKAMGNRFKVTHLIRRPRGHGQSYSLNYGVDQATGEFVLFLDDDDTWTDMSHLSRVNQATLSYAEIDIFMTNQNAYLSNVKKTESVWLENFERDLLQEQVRADSNKFYSVPLDILMKATGFCHLNCLTVRRTLYQSIGGMDEGIRWE
jgi:glycosyltransferase involved in cell wall biosynthesis